MEAGLLPGRNDRRKVFLIQIKVTRYFGGFSAVLRIAPVFAPPVSGRYSEVLHLRIGAPGCRQCARPHASVAVR